MVPGTGYLAKINVNLGVLDMKHEKHDRTFSAIKIQMNYFIELNWTEFKLYF